MRVNPSATVATPAVSRSEVSKSTPTLKSTAELKPAVERKPVDEFCIAPGGCFPRPIPFPPFPRPGDANGRTQARQLHDIAEGVRNGSITPQEAERLLKQQENISQATERAMADGKLTTEEKLKLQLMQAQADLNIYQAGHNGQRDFFARFDSTAQEQAKQIDQIANGRTNGNITASEASELLDEQKDIAEERGDAHSFFDRLLVQLEQAQAGGDIAFDSLPGDQTKWGGGIEFPANLPPKYELDSKLNRDDLKPFRTGTFVP